MIAYLFPNDPSNKIPNNVRNVSLVLLALVTLLTFVNVVTPLRLNTDGIRYLMIVEFMKGNLDSNSVAAKDFLPHGYPRLLWLIDRVGLLNGTMVTIMNLCSLLLAGYFVTKLLPLKNRAIFFVCLMLSFVNIKQSTLAVSDHLFSFLFFLAIYLWTASFKGKRWAILPAFLVTVISIYVRTAGIALVAGIGFYMVFRSSKTLFRSKIVIAAIVAAVVAGIVAFMINLTYIEQKVDYVRQLNLPSFLSNPIALLDRILLHVLELGEVILNIPNSKLGSLLHIHSFDAARYLLIALGLVSIYLIYRAIKTTQLYKHFLFYPVIAYLLMIALWPAYDTRFLLPLIPVIAYLLINWISALSYKPLYKVVLALPFFCLGVTSALYSAGLSTSKTFFLNHYGFDPVLTSKYRTHFDDWSQGKYPVYSIHDEPTLYLLEQYDR